MNEVGRDVGEDEAVETIFSNSINRAFSERASCWSFSCNRRSCSEMECLNEEDEVDHRLELDGLMEELMVVLEAKAERGRLDI